MEYSAPNNPTHLNKLFIGLFLAIVLVGYCGYSLSNIFSHPSQLNINNSITIKKGAENSLSRADNNPAQSEPNCAVSNKFPKRIFRWCNLITLAAQKYQLDPDLIAAIIWVESGGDSQALSASGAIGLMQIMPQDGVAAQFQCASGPCFANRPPSEQL
ncbi:MAG: transglycosylase SLT domain-containing protein, partial [Anaerolineales bacterium]